ncbi:MAG: chorismate-binding protein [Candidatus Bathyarchaeota archaeon]|nr:chorismate-binding protein [Candidatus Bathyarchaeota archaeon]
MAKCPKCGAEVTKPLKEWDLSPKLHVILYECAHCGKKFRGYVKK